MRETSHPVLGLLATFFVLVMFTGSGSAQVKFGPGRYVGTVVINHVGSCEESVFGQSNRPPGRASTDVFLNVTSEGAVLTLELESVGNTAAKNWFETKPGTLRIASGHVIGGIRHHTMYYFDVNFKHNAATGQYVGKGTWIFQDQCESKDPRYLVTITLRASAPQTKLATPQPPSPVTPKSFHPCYVNSGSVASAGPCKGAPGSLLWVHLSKQLPNPPASLTFKAALAHGVPAAVTSPLSGSGQYYSTAVPAALCAAGTGGKWDIFLLDSSAQLWGNIGQLTADCGNITAQHN